MYQNDYIIKQSVAFIIFYIALNLRFSRVLVDLDLETGPSVQSAVHLGVRILIWKVVLL